MLSPSAGQAACTSMPSGNRCSHYSLQSCIAEYALTKFEKAGPVHAAARYPRSQAVPIKKPHAAQARAVH